MSATRTGSTHPPLCVDLDGTVLLGDVGIESILELLRRNPLYALALPVWLLRGLAVLKREVARRVTLDPSTLPWDARVLAWVRDESASRPCLLVSASDELLVRPIAEHLGCFVEVMASDGHHNLAGRNKAQALVQRFGKQGFDYAGNSRSDLAVWPHARAAIVANASARVRRQAQRSSTVEQQFPHQRAGLSVWARSLRLHQWVKNLLVFAPLVGAHLLTDSWRLRQGLIAWLLFGLCTSGTYLLNDLFDLDADRHHPRKRKRALASGRIGLANALGVAVVLIASAFVGATWLLPPAFRLWLAAYLVTTLAYSLLLKRVILLDVVILAALFTLRIVAGGAATAVIVSHWLLWLAMLAFFGLALLKRYAELIDLGPDQSRQARGRGYYRTHKPMVLALGLAAGAAVVATLGLYVDSPDSHALYARPTILWFLCPLLAYWLGRLWWLAMRHHMHDDPTVFATRDIVSWIVLILAGLVVWGAA